MMKSYLSIAAVDFDEAMADKYSLLSFENFDL